MSLPMVAVFWDYENCSPPSYSLGLGFDIVNNISRIARPFGSITSFRAYLDISAQSPKSALLRSELQSSGLSIIDCPHNGKKDVVDKMILVDMLAFAIDHPSPTTIFLITGDRDYAYAVSILKLRKYQVILVVPSSPHTSPSLESQASLVIDWGSVIRSRTEQPNSTQPLRQPYSDLDPNLINKLLRELREPPLDDPGSVPQGPSGLRRVTAQNLFELPRHSKNESFDSTQESTNPTCTSTVCDGVLPTPKTPSRSRHASLSTGPTRSTTNLPQSPPTVETPSKNPQPRRPSTSNLTGVASPEKRNVSVLTSPNTLESPLHDDRPPSSIIVHSPSEPARSESDTPGVSNVPSSRKLNCLAAPFVLSKPLTGLGSVSNEESLSAINSPSVAPTTTPKSLQHSGLTIAQLYRLKPTRYDFNEPLTALQAEDKGDFEQSFSPRPDFTKSTHVAPHAAHSLSDRNVGLHDSLAAVGLPGVGDRVDLVQFAALSCAPSASDCFASGTMSAPSSSTSPPAPSTASDSDSDSNEDDGSQRGQTWTMFKPLIHLLLASRARGILRPSRSAIAVDLVSSDRQVYRRAGVSKFKDYTALAERAGVITLGGIYGEAWIALHPNWSEGVGVTSTQSPSDRSSPTFDPPKATSGQDSSSRGSDGAASFETPGSRSTNASPASPTSRQDSDSCPAQFQPLMDTLVRMRAAGCRQPRRSLVGQMFKPFVYFEAGVSGFNEYILKASEAQIVKFGGIGGFAWISLHPDLQV